MIDKIESDKGKLIMLYLSVENKATIDEIKENLDLKYMEVYSIIKKLIEKQIIEPIDSETYRLSDIDINVSLA